MPNSGKVERDPRVEPQEGDVLTKYEFKRKVIHIQSDLVYYHRISEDGSYIPVPYCSITSWRLWAKDAEVIHAD